MFYKANDAEVDDDEDEIADDAGEAAEDGIIDGFAKPDIADTSLDQSSFQMLNNYTDPIEWKTELERVGPRLRANQSMSSNEWRSHVDQTVSTKAVIDKLLTDTHDELKIIGRYFLYIYILYYLDV